MMKQFKLFISLCLALSAIYSCSPKEKAESSNEETIQVDTNLVLFPHIQPDSTVIEGNNLQFNFTDSRPIYNAISSNQSVFIYALQLEKPQQAFDSIEFFIKMPNRDPNHVHFTISQQQFFNIAKEYSNPIYKEFLKELLKLNYSTRNRYKNTNSSILQETNLIFAQAIEENYPKQFPTNSTLFGYNSLHIFGMYFGEVSNTSQGIAHDLMLRLKDSKETLNAYDKKTLLELVETYAAKFKPSISQ